MKVMHRRCAGLDVHSEQIVAAIRVSRGRAVEEETRSFSATTGGLVGLRDWLESFQVTHVAMEATGVYWKPVWHVLDGGFDLVLVNALHVRNVPGRKSDVSDAGWLASLLAHGLVRSSFVPPQPIQELRDLTRTRKQLTREVVQHAQRIQRTLEDANIKLTETISNVLGTSGRAMLQAIVAGESDPTRLAELAHPRLRASRESLVEALRGRLTEHHRFLIGLHLRQVDALQAEIAVIESRIKERIEPFRGQLELLVTIPGVSTTVAQAIIAEIGVDMTRFPTAGHLISWAGLCPRMDESAGKRRSTRIRKGAPWLKTMLVQSAWCAARTKDSYFRAQFLRLKSRRGPKKAAIAVAASILTAAYFMLERDQSYHDLGIEHFQSRDKQALVTRLAARIRSLGYSVEVRAA